ncbi:RNA uridylyltransferase [Aureococcus anophagefferens]|nr:RNA uridylyltransferase [Aureococcus anophagefferens]
MAKHPALMKRKAPDANNTQPSTAPSPQQQRAAILASPTKASPTAKRSWSQPLGPLSKKRPPPQPLADSNTLKRPRPASPSSSSASSFEGDVAAEARAAAASAAPGPRAPAAAARAAKTAATAARGSAGACFVLACKYDEPNKNGDCPDHLRLDALQELYPGLKVIGCSEYVPRSEKRRSADAEIVAQNAKHDTHVAANFKKSLRDIIKNTDPKVLMLDYFWLQPGYYEERYGMNWLQSKIRELFVSYRCEVLLLPVDSRGAVRRMHDASFDDRPAGIEIEFVSEADGLKHHPLRRRLAGLPRRPLRAPARARALALELRPLAPPPKPGRRAAGKSPAPPAAPAAAPPAPPPLFDEDSDDEDTPLSVLLARAGP